MKLFRLYLYIVSNIINVFYRYYRFSVAIIDKIHTRILNYSLVFKNTYITLFFQGFIYGRFFLMSFFVHNNTAAAVWPDKWSNDKLHEILFAVYPAGILDIINHTGKTAWFFSSLGCCSSYTHINISIKRVQHEYSYFKLR